MLGLAVDCQIEALRAVGFRTVAEALANSLPHVHKMQVRNERDVVVPVHKWLAVRSHAKVHTIGVNVLERQIMDVTAAPNGGLDVDAAFTMQDGVSIRDVAHAATHFRSDGKPASATLRAGDVANEDILSRDTQVEPVAVETRFDANA